MSRPNVVYIVVDSMRADHLGCYGYGRDTSPCIDKVAKDSLVFDRAFAAGIPTMPSFTTLFSGLHPYRHGIAAHASDNRLARDIALLPQLARAAGYTTIGIDNLAVQSNGRGSWFTRGFDYYSGFLYQPFSDQSERLVDRATGFIDEYGDDPFLLFLHLWDPHSPYGPPPPYDTMHYSGEAEPGDPKLADVVARAPEYYEAFLDDMKLKVKDDYGYVVAQYDGEISYVDLQIGRLADHLKQKGLWEDTLFVIQSDHGECFGEGGVYFDHHGLYDAVVRIALIMKPPIRALTSTEPSEPTGSRCNAMVSTEDVLPTLADLCGFELPTYPLTGVSFAPALDGHDIAGRAEVFFVESTRQASLALRTSRWKLIQPIILDEAGAPIPGVYGEARSARPALYDLETDPAETRDVGDDFPDVRRQLSDRLSAWRDEETARHGNDPVLGGLSLPYDDFMSRLTARKLRG